MSSLSELFSFLFLDVKMLPVPLLPSEAAILAS
uniref:Uncharacterized protein n=1 Tax=Anguilla anguilla TaxID=7936 RepID=A0A0E9U062_ANGAN